LGRLRIIAAPAHRAIYETPMPIWQAMEVQPKSRTKLADTRARRLIQRYFQG